MPITASRKREELLFLLYNIPFVFVRYVFDGIISLFVPKISNPNYVASLLHTQNDEKVTKSLSSTPSSVGGVGGHGTERFWYSFETNLNNKIHTFVKTRTNDFIGSFFLNLFDVYSNEIRFYQYLQKEQNNHSPHKLPKDFFPKVYDVQRSFFKTNFSLILENVLITRKKSQYIKIDFPNVSPDFPNPLRRVLACLDTHAMLHANYCHHNAPKCIWGGSLQTPRPMFLQLIARHSLNDCIKRFPNLIPQNLIKYFDLFLDHYELIRQHWSSGLTTLIHGDSYLGNFYFEELFSKPIPNNHHLENEDNNNNDDNKIIETKARMYDFQVVSHEHPMRDIIYYISSSVSNDVLQEYGNGTDEPFIKYYLSKYHEYNGIEMSYEEAYENYQLHGFYTLSAFIISIGAGDDFFESEKAKFVLNRICQACVRNHIEDALIHTLKKYNVHI